MKQLKLSYLLVLATLLVSCSVMINPEANIQVDKETIFFDYTLIGKTQEQVVEIVNLGQKEAQLVSVRVNVNDTNTTYREFDVTPSIMEPQFYLYHESSIKVTITFSPDTIGDKKATLVVQAIVKDECLFYEFPITGKAYSGEMSITPEVYGFSHCYIGERREHKFHILNKDTRPLTITSIDLKRDVNSFSIISGWNGEPFVIEPMRLKAFTLEFKPNSHGYKRVIIEVRNAESDYVAKSDVAAFCCETLQIDLPYQLPAAEHGKPYELKLKCIGGSGGYVFAIDGTLPEGLEYDKDTQLISGTPEEHGDFPFTIHVSDSVGHPAKGDFNLHVSYAMLYRNPMDVDPQYVFDRDSYTGTYTVNVVAEGDIPLEIRSVKLTGIGVSAGEAQIISNNVPDVMNNGDTARIRVRVVSKLDTPKYALLTIEHTGYNTDFKQALEWDIVHQTKIVFILERSNEMRFNYDGGPVYDRNFDVIPYPSKWEAAQYFVTQEIAKLHPGDSFEVITFGDYVYTCFGSLTDANTYKRQQAINWVYSQTAANFSNLYDALRAAYNGYGTLDAVEVYTVGKPDTALSLGCNGGECPGWIGDRIIQDTEIWMQPSKNWNSNHYLKAVQIGGNPLQFMTQLGSLPSAYLVLK